MTAPISSEPIDMHNFSIATKRLETEILKSTIDKANELARDTISKNQARRILHTLPNQAFKTFQIQLKEKFPDHRYNDLVFLTIESRSNLFLIDLKEKLSSIIQL